jgi:hypothetical protein
MSGATRYEGGLLLTGPTSTDCGFNHPDEASFTGDPSDQERHPDGDRSDREELVQPTAESRGEAAQSTPKGGGGQLFQRGDGGPPNRQSAGTTNKTG